MSKRVLLAVGFAFLLTVPVWAGPVKAAGVSGKWSGANDTRACKECTRRSHPIYVVLNLQGHLLTGSAGPSELRQHPFQDGKVTGNVVTFQFHSLPVIPIAPVPSISSSL